MCDNDSVLIFIAGALSAAVIMFGIALLLGADDPVIPPCELVHSWTMDMVEIDEVESVMADFRAAGYTKITATQQGSNLAIKGAC